MALIQACACVSIYRHGLVNYGHAFRYLKKSLCPLECFNHFGNTRFNSKVEHIIEWCSILWIRAVRMGTGRLRQGLTVLTLMTSTVWMTNMIELDGCAYNRYGLKKVFSVSCLHVAIFKFFKELNVCRN